MKTHFNPPFTPRVISEKDRLLNIPIYQRLFVWENEQIDLLLSDLWKSWNNNNGLSVPYYIGIITVVEKSNGSWDVVDGQQRLTFLSLFAAYVKSLLKPNESCVWNSFLYYNTNNLDKNSLRINYSGRPEDRDNLQAIATGYYDKNHNQNFKKFIDCVKKYSNNKNDFALFASYVYNNTSFLVSELPNNFGPKDLNAFFEKMNSSGRQLTPIEQIKGNYFPSRALQFDVCLNFEKKYVPPTEDNYVEDKKSISDILELGLPIVDENTDEQKEETSSRSVLAPEIFLLHSLSIALEANGITNPDIPKDKRKIVGTFSNNVGTDKFISPDTLLKTMSCYRSWLDLNIIYLSNDGNASDYKFWFLNTDDQKEQSDVENDDIKKLKQFQSMLYVSSSDWQDWVLEAYLYCYHNNTQLTLDLLKSQDVARHKLPDNISIMSYESIDRYWFWKLDYILWETISFGKLSAEIVNNRLIDDEQIKAITNYKFRRNRSVEHLHPQTDNMGEDNPWEKDHELLFGGTVFSIKPKHWFGNLALISSAFNSAQGNESIGVKFARLRDTQIPQKNLESIKMLLMFIAADGKNDRWTIELANTQGKAMCELLWRNHNTLS